MFIPLHDANAREHIVLHYVTLGVILANGIVFLSLELDWLTGAAGDIRSFALIPATFTDAMPRPEALSVLPEEATLVTYAFLHADFWHLLGNMLFLWVFGDNVEDALGHFKFLLFYVLCALAAGLLHVTLDRGSPVPLVGASGAVAGVVAAYLLLHPRVRVWILVLWRVPVRLSAAWVLGAWVVLQIYYVVADTAGGVSWWAHIGGLVAGALLVLILRRPGVPLFDRDLPAEVSRP